MQFDDENKSTVPAIPIRIPRDRWEQFMEIAKEAMRNSSEPQQAQPSVRESVGYGDVQRPDETLLDFRRRYNKVKNRQPLPEGLCPGHGEAGPCDATNAAECCHAYGLSGGVCGCVGHTTYHDSLPQHVG